MVDMIFEVVEICIRITLFSKQILYECKYSKYFNIAKFHDFKSLMFPNSAVS